MTLAQDLKEEYDKLPSKKKQTIIMASIIIVAFLVFYLSANSGDGEDALPETNGKASETLTITSDLMEDSLRESVRSESEAVTARMNDLEKLVGDLIDRLDASAANKGAPVVQQEEEPEEVGLITEEDLKPSNELAQLALPEEPRYPPAFTPPVDSGATLSDPELQANVVQVIGGIGGVKPILEPAEVNEATNRVYLPVGMMEAVLLTGLDALVGNQAQANPEPILLRVQTPAVLPNDVRANLEGCFVVGNGIGILAKERVDVRAVSLSCVDKSARTVIDQPIKGYFVDTDGKKGLSGRVVTRDGAIVGRAFATGLLEGFGRVAEAGAGTQTVSPLGATRVFDTEQAVVSGLGQGIGTATGNLSEYYLDLAKTITPVIEVGTQKRAVLVIQEGVYLEIKEVDNVAGS